jgi:hypothetical protein
MFLGMFAFEMPVRIPAEDSKPEIGERSLYIDLAVWDRLDKIAKKLGRSRNKLVAGILRDWVTEYDAEGKAKK